ncbi:MAG: type II secretion system protein [Candidatus Krumholzibacteriota bacterium]|nr:type II secretion system protein [Candidatus Krumholzibacteriota bacterium]
MLRFFRYLTGILAIGARGRRKKRSLLGRIGIAGFTLLELFIVVEIIGFLATIVISNFYRSKKAAQVAVTVQNIKNVQTALFSYFAMENEFPPTLNTIWLQFYGGKVVADFDYIGGATSVNQAGWEFFASNSIDIRFSGPTVQEYAIRSKEELLPYALYVYGDVATSAKIVH